MIVGVKTSQAVRQIDHLIRQAKLTEAHKEFKRLEKSKWDKSYLIEICQLARRLNLPLSILRWLHPIVRNENAFQEPPTDLQRALFCIGLTRVGAFREAEEVLKDISANTPDVLMAKGMLATWQWKYEKAIPLFTQYCALFDRKDYSYLVGHVNLIASLVACDRHEQAADLISSVLPLLQAGDYTLLRSNLLEILAQSQIRQGNFIAAQNNLNLSANLIKGPAGDYELFVKKWKVVIEILSSESLSDQTYQKWLELRSIGLAIPHYELVRELDFYFAVGTKNKDLFLKVYHGTRFAGYCKRMRRVYGEAEIPSRSFTCDFKVPNGADFVTEIEICNLELSKTSKQLLSTLLSDFYRPIQIGEVFSDIYPEEYFNPLSSPARLYQCYSRLKKEINHLGLPFELRWHHRHISWQPIQNFRYRFRHRTQKKSAIDVFHLGLNSSRFTLADVQKAKSCSARSASRWLSQHIKNKNIIRLKPGLFKLRSKHDQG